MIWRTAGAQQAVLSPPPLHSLLPSLSLLLLKKVGTLQLQEYFRRRIYFYYSFKLIPKKWPPGEITGVTVLN